MRLLIVEDDVDLASGLAMGFRDEGLAVDLVSSGRAGLLEAGSGEYDVVILDVMLPDLDGFQVVERLRDQGVRVPILLLTARDAIEDRVRGLRLGGDDYLCKPFSFDELLARIRVLLRRAGGAARNLILWRSLVVDLDRRIATWQGSAIPLTPKEFAVLEALVLNLGKTVARTRLAEAMYELDFDRASNVIDVHMANLRRKLSESTGQPIVQTVRGTGFRIPEADE